MLRNITVFVIILGSFVIAGFAARGRSADSKPVPQAVEIPVKIQAAKAPPTGVADGITIDYDLQFTEPNQRATRLQLTLSGRMGDAIRTTLDGMENCKLEIETVSHREGTEPYYVTSLKLVGKDKSERQSDRWFCPKLRSPAGMPATIAIAPYEFQVTVRNLQ